MFGGLVCNLNGSIKLHVNKRNIVNLESNGKKNYYNTNTQLNRISCKTICNDKMQLVS